MLSRRDNTGDMTNTGSTLAAASRGIGRKAYRDGMLYSQAMAHARALGADPGEAGKGWVAERAEAETRSHQHESVKRRVTHTIAAASHEDFGADYPSPAENAGYHRAVERCSCGAKRTLVVESDGSRSSTPWAHSESSMCG